jgi:hypothetical protein
MRRTFERFKSWLTWWNSSFPIAILALGLSSGCGGSVSSPSGGPSGVTQRTLARTKEEYQAQPPEVHHYVFHHNELLKEKEPRPNGSHRAKKQDFNGTWRCVGEGGVLTVLLFDELWQKYHDEQVARLNFKGKDGLLSGGVQPVTLNEAEGTLVFTQQDYPTGFATNATARLHGNDRLQLKGQLVLYNGTIVIDIDVPFVRVASESTPAGTGRQPDKKK